MTSPLLTLNDGQLIPQLGFGVYKIRDADAASAVRVAIDAGYRHIDTASLYRNESGVGAGIAASGVPRDELFVTTKVWNDDQGYDRTLRAFDASVRRLGLESVDLYLIHWPAPKQDRFVDTWRALEKLKADGRTRSIGVSNFEPHHLARLLELAQTIPSINQIELHPWLQQRELRVVDHLHEILTEAWSPLARGRAMGDPTLEAIGARHGKTAAQVVIRWHLQIGNVVIPKSVTPARIRENFDVFDFTLDESDLAAIDALDADARTGSHPDDVG